jgi:hypothetical protein
VLRILDIGRSLDRLSAELGPEVDESAILAVLEELTEQKLVAEWEGHYLSLPVFRERSRSVGEPKSSSLELRVVT